MTYSHMGNSDHQGERDHKAEHPTGGHQQGELSQQQIRHGADHHHNKGLNQFNRPEHVDTHLMGLRKPGFLYGPVMTEEQRHTEEHQKQRSSEGQQQKAQEWHQRGGVP